MRSSNSLWREARSILIRHCEEDGLSMSVMPGVHLMRFGWRSLPLVATQFPCMAMVIQGTNSVEFGEAHLEYGAGHLVPPALGSFRFPAARDLPKRQSVQSHCRGDRLDQETFCRGFHGGGTGTSRGDESNFIPPALQDRYRHDADSVSTAYPSSGGEEKPAYRVNQHL